MQVQAQLRSFPARSFLMLVALVLALALGGLAGYAVRAISVAGSAAPAASTVSTPSNFEDEYARHFASEHPGAVPNATGQAVQHSHDERSDFGLAG